MKKLVTYVSAFFASFLPVRYRRRFELEGSVELRAATMVSGLAQAAACTAIDIARLYVQIDESMGRAGMAVLSVLGSHGGDEQAIRLTTGVLGLANFVLQPLNMLLMYFVIEGLIRCIAAMATRETFGTLPLYLVAWVHGWKDEIQFKKMMGPVIIDVIQPPTEPNCDVRVLSCRPKHEWNPYITVRFRDQFYMLAGEEVGENPRPFVYRLRKNPAWRAVVVIREYQLDDIIKKPPYQGL